MFGLGFGELCVIIVVAMIVIGPRDLPKVMRKAGQWAGKLRRMAAEARAQSGIDDILKDSTLGTDIHELRKLARGELDNVIKTSIDAPGVSHSGRASGLRADDAALALPASTSSTAHHHEDPYDSNDAASSREREYPRDGADSYRALPDTAFAYGDGYPPSAFAADPLYADGDIHAPPRKSAPPIEPPPVVAETPREPPSDDAGEANPDAAT